jgi:hypothetical protein
LIVEDERWCLDAAECERSRGAFLQNGLLLSQATFLPVSILTIEFLGPEQRVETPRWRGKIQWIAEDPTKGVANEKLLDSRAVCDHHFSPSRCDASCRSSRRARRAERHRACND